ncbi:hypothetical protein ABF162_08480 [Vibrio coralliilyticus]|uniref:hypothetical protein n=1 Tax=Vibrio coralliilyticus TaxID=190893 RepID=UPI000512742D|nr:hypothetical protein [Vibrio coralliilyticus]AIU67031.1 hypothetical protein JV59_32465 [Vibrio coralliilyticus]NRF16581.1 hypothetical protein [Vibrio coralliilyticus]
MKKRDVFFCVAVWLTLALVVLAAFNSKERTKHFNNITELSEQASYSMTSSAFKFGVEPVGKLGSMYDCLANFRPTATKNPSKDAVGTSGHLILEVGLYQIYLSINSGEATSATLTKYDEQRGYEYGSSSVAVNCDISLLNKFN